MERISPPDQETIKDILRAPPQSEKNLSHLPLKYARIIRSVTPQDDIEMRHQAIGLVRNWVEYAKRQDLSDDNPYLIRHHITRFASETFGRQHEYVNLSSVDIGKVCTDNFTYEELVEAFVPPEIITDKDVAIIGGTARLALKMYAGIEIQDELPVNDIDTIISTDSDIPQKAEKYGVDLTGAKIIDGGISEVLPDIITNFDCTMNQVAVYDGKLLFSEQALKDIKEGNIRLIAKDDPLFGSEGIVMPDGNVYLNRNGFYRGLSFLLRGKGKKLIVSQENIDAEKDNIGRYWLVMLFVKILTMKNEGKQKDAIANWHEIARRIGSTDTPDPESFLNELTDKYPEMYRYGENGSFDTDAQVRWIIGKLAKKAFNSIREPREVILPTTYTKADLQLTDSVEEYDYNSFILKVKS
jgi:hypothetical protein